MKTSLLRARPHLWYQLYWVLYLIWFFWLDLTVTDPNYIIHSPLDDFIPFNEWFIFPYGRRSCPRTSSGRAYHSWQCRTTRAVP